MDSQNLIFIDPKSGVSEKLYRLKIELIFYNSIY